jgi:hypothetical protein
MLLMSHLVGAVAAVSTVTTAWLPPHPHRDTTSPQHISPTTAIVSTTATTTTNNTCIFTVLSTCQTYKEGCEVEQLKVLRGAEGETSLLLSPSPARLCLHHPCQPC